MPTNSSPGGRWLAGGDKIPPIMGPRALWAYNVLAVSTSIKIARLFLRNTAFSFTAVLLFRYRCLLRGRLSSNRDADLCSASRTHRQSTLADQIHGALDRNVRHTGLLIDPSIAIQLIFLLQQEVLELAALIAF